MTDTHDASETGQEIRVAAQRWHDYTPCAELEEDRQVIVRTIRHGRFVGMHHTMPVGPI